MEAAERIEEVQKDFRGFSQDLVLCLAGVFALHDVKDEVIWEVARSLDRVFDRYQGRFGGRTPNGNSETGGRRHRPHPAMAYLLHRLSRRGGAR